MSLVGTRPPAVDEWEQYELHHRSRMSTKPGITGMWQVSGRSDITDFEEVVRLDTEYIENWSISDIMKETGLSRSSVHSYLPYTKVIYNAEELSLYARRCRTYRKRKQAVQKLQSCMRNIIINTVLIQYGMAFLKNHAMRLYKKKFLKQRIN